MKVSVETAAPESVAADWLAVGVGEGDDAPGLAGRLGELLGPRIASLRRDQDFEGKRFELLSLYDVPGIAARRVLLVGLGKSAEVNRTVLFRAASAAARAIAKKQRGTVVAQLFADPGGQISIDVRAAEMAAGLLNGVCGPGLYRQEKNRFPMQEVRIACRADEGDAVAAGLDRGRIIGECIRLAREMVNTIPAELYPESFCDRARQAAEPFGIRVEVLGPDQLREQKMGCILGVGGGSMHPPRLLILRYDGASDPRVKTLCFVGKGITFDSGGLSLKSADNMKDMKCDMSGAATVLAATIAIARRRLPVRLLTLAALAENMPDGAAIRPGDVLTAKNGKTIEVVNTDAEGRLVLADALAHGVDLGADHIVDLATLTGACMVALGLETAGVMSNNKLWADRLLAVAERTGESVWPLPMFDEFNELIKSDVADMKNSGGRYGGAITAAKLLERFVADRPWAHVDIAGPAFAEKDDSHRDSGGTGYFVRTLVELAETYPQIAAEL